MISNDSESMIGENRTPRSSPSMSVSETQDPTIETLQKTMEERFSLQLLILIPVYVLYVLVILPLNNDKEQYLGEYVPADTSKQLS